MKFRLIATVWGDSFTDLFLKVTVRSLLAEGNAAALSMRYPTGFTIYTMPESAALMRASPFFKMLERSVDVEVVEFRPGEIDLRNPASHWLPWRRGAEVARKNGEFAFFIIADVLYSKGCLIRWAELFEQGYRAIWTPATQVVLETTLDEVNARFPATSSDAISLSRAEVMSLSIRHLHPTMVTMFRDTRRTSRHPEVVFSAAPGPALMMRAISSHLFCVDPRAFSLSDAFSPLDRLDAIVLDDPRSVSLEPMLKAPDLYMRIDPLNEDRLSNNGSWVDFFCTPSDMLVSQHTFCFSEADVRDTREFRRADAALGFFACQCRLTGAIYRAIRMIRSVGCRRAAAIAASAHYIGPLRRHWTIRGPVTVLVPNDDAIAALGQDTIDDLLRPGSERLLIESVMQHVLVGTHHFRAGDKLRLSPTLKAHAATGEAVTVEGSITITSGPHHGDGCTIYVIDRSLIHPVARAARRTKPALPVRWAINPARLLVPASSEAQPAPTTPVPAQPEFEDNLLPHVFARDTPPRQRVAYLAWWVARMNYRALSRIPGIKALADGVKTAVVGALHNSPTMVRLHRAITEREQAQQKHLFGSQAAMIGAPAGNQDMSVDLPAPDAGGKAQRATDDHNAPSPAAIETYYDVQYGLIILTMAEILRSYEAKLGESRPDFLPPLHALEDCIKKANLSVDRMASLLRDLLHETPNFAEAWYELGDIHMVRDEHSEAIRCFDECLLSASVVPRVEGRAECHELAAMGKAFALEQVSAYDQAAEVYRNLTSYYRRQGLTRVAYARVLRRLGRLQEACSEFDSGMESEHPIRQLPRTLRDFDVVAQRLQERLGSSCH